MHQRMGWIFSLALLAACLAVPAAWADDCRAQGKHAYEMIQDFKQAALRNQHPDQAKFQAQFDAMVNKLQQDQCFNELMGLMTFIQCEQQQFPAPPNLAGP